MGGFGQPQLKGSEQEKVFRMGAVYPKGVVLE